MNIFRRKTNPCDPDIGKIAAHNLESEEKIVVASNQVTAVANQIGINLEENQEFSRKIFDNAKRMTELNRSFESELNGIFGDINSFISRLDTIGRFSSDMKTEGENSRSVLSDSLESTRSIIEEIHSINDKTVHSVEMMRNLKKLSSDITQVLEAVAEISDQTKLLSLNATIESARAGAAGAGFSIVAQHIQRLSDESQQAVDNIHTLVDQLFKSMERVDRALEENVRQVKETSAKCMKVGTDLSQIQQSFDRLVSRCLTVREEVITEQTQTSGIQGKISALKDSSSENLSRIDEVYLQLSRHHESMDELGDLGNRLSKAAADLQPLIDERAVKYAAAGMVSSELKSSVIARMTKGVASCGKDLLKKENAKEFCDSFLAGDTAIEAAWINDVKGRFTYSNPPAGIANAKLREWFRSAVEGNDFISGSYLSAITGKSCVTFSIPVLNAGKEVIGVLGCDIRI